jgi:aryl-alcohol dehydrogenase-like predicted oxidoreductase
MHVMQRRPYGNTREELSIIAMGGIVVMGVEQSEADRTTRQAFERGINYYDVAPSYGDAEERLGPALQPFRDQVFRACKTTQRKKQEAANELRASLKRLRTDHFDLYQLHAVSSVEEADTCLGPGGALEAILEARDAGLVRYIGFSAHSAEAAVKLLEQFPFDSVLFPFNYTTYHQAGFGPQVMDAAQKRGAARLALKAMARRPWLDGADKSACQNCWYEPHTDPAEAELALRWTLSLSVTAAIPPGDPRLFRMALEFAERFQPLTEEERTEVERKAIADTPLFTLAGAA